MEYPSIISPTNPPRKRPPSSHGAASAQLDLFCDAAEESHSPEAPKSTAVDLLADLLRQRLAYSSARRRQGVVH